MASSNSEIAPREPVEIAARRVGLVAALAGGDVHHPLEEFLVHRADALGREIGLRPTHSTELRRGAILARWMIDMLAASEDGCDAYSEALLMAHGLHAPSSPT
jgi:hypothetical protein